MLFTETGAEKVTEPANVVDCKLVIPETINVLQLKSVTEVAFSVEALDTSKVSSDVALAVNESVVVEPYAFKTLMFATVVAFNAPLTIAFLVNVASSSKLDLEYVVKLFSVTSANVVGAVTFNVLLMVVRASTVSVFVLPAILTLFKVVKTSLTFTF